MWTWFVTLMVSVLVLVLLPAVHQVEMWEVGWTEVSWVQMMFYWVRTDVWTPACIHLMGFKTQKVKL